MAGAARAEGSFSGTFILAAAFEERNPNPLCAGWYCNLISVFGIVDEAIAAGGTNEGIRRIYANTSSCMWRNSTRRRNLKEYGVMAKIFKYYFVEV